MIETSKLYKSIDFLNTEIYKPGKQHPFISKQYQQETKIEFQ